MFDIGIDILRAAIVGGIFLYLRSAQGKERFRLGKGWILILIGVGLFFLGSLLDITDNFPGLSKYIILGKTKYEDFLEEVLGYFVGFIFVAIGFWKWTPAIVALREEKMALKKSQEELQFRIEELKAELNAVRVQLEEKKTLLHESQLS